MTAAEVTSSYLVRGVRSVELAATNLDEACALL